METGINSPVPCASCFPEMTFCEKCDYFPTERGEKLCTGCKTWKEGNPDTEASLCADLKRWCYEQKLPFVDAMELLYSDDLDETQVAWIHNFINRWEAVIK